MKHYKVLQTIIRSEARGDYIIEISEKSRKALKLGEYAVVTHEFHGKEGPIRFVAYGKVLIDNKIDENCVKIDQTLRDTVRVFVGDKIGLSKLELSAHQRTILSIRRFFSARSIWAYVCKAYPRDMEKNICRLSREAREVLGVAQGDLLRLDSVFFDEHGAQYQSRSITLRGFDLSDDEVNQTRQEAQKRARKLIGKTKELKGFESHRLPFLRICKEARINLSSEENEIELLQPVKISPNILYLVRNRVQFYIVNLFLALVGTVITIQGFSWIAGMLVLVVCIIIITIGVYLDIKSKVS